MTNTNSGAIKMVAFGCVALLLAGGCIGAATIIAVVAMKSGDASATAYTKAFFANLREGDREDALHRMSHRYQATHTAAQFAGDLDSISSLKSHQADDPTEENETGNRATVTGTLSGPEGETNFAAQLEHRGEYWYVDELKVGNQTIQ